MISTKASAVSDPTPGCVLKRCASGHFSASCSMVCVNSAIVGLSRSSTPSRSLRRRLAHGANGNASSCSRPASRHSLFLQCRPSLSATACSWFMIRVRACTTRVSPLKAGNSRNCVCSVRIQQEQPSLCWFPRSISDRALNASVPADLEILLDQLAVKEIFFLRFPNWCGLGLGQIDRQRVIIWWQAIDFVDSLLIRNSDDLARGTCRCDLCADERCVRRRRYQPLSKGLRLSHVSYDACTASG